MIVPGYEASGWFAICVPTGTPAEIVARLDKELSTGEGDADMRNRLLAVGAEPRAMTSAELNKFMADETIKYRQVIKFADIKPL